MSGEATGKQANEKPHTYRSDLVKKSVIPVDWSDPVPVFLVRYALADTDSHTPQLSGAFKLDHMAPAPGTHYTLRRPRKGYIYTFCEVNKFWNIFAVNEWGVLSPIDRKNDEAHKHLNLGYTNNGLIKIPSKAPVWFCFTTHRLSQSTLSRAASDEHFMGAFMRRLDPRAWQGKPHTAPLGSAESHVAELAKGLGGDPLGFSPFPFARQGFHQLTDEIGTEGIRRGLVLALGDPAGAAMDTRGLMAYRLHKFMIEPERARRIHCHAAITNLQLAVQSNAEHLCWEERRLGVGMRQAIDQEKFEKLRQRANAQGSKGIPVGDYQRYAQERATRENQHATLIKAKIDKAREDSWKEYAPYINQKALDNWPDELQTKLSEYTATAILPLAEMHAKWMESASIYKVFRYHYDSSVEDRGGTYAELFAACTEGTQSWEPCRKLYLKWMGEANITPKNLAMRALLNNDSRLINKANQLGAKLGKDPHSANEKVLLPSITQLAGDLGTMVAHRRGAVAREMMGALTELVGQSLKDGGIRLSLNLVAAFEGKTILLTTYQGSLRDLLRNLGQLIQINNPKLVRGAADTLAERLVIRQGQDAFSAAGKARALKWATAVELDELPGLAARGSAGGTIHSLEALERLPSSRWQGFKRSGGVLNLIVPLLQTGSLCYNLKSFNDAQAWQKLEEGVRLGAGVCGWASSVAVTLYKLAFPAISMGLKETVWLTRFQWLGVAGAIINGVVDVVKTMQAISKGDGWHAAAFFTSAVSGVVSALILGTSLFEGIAGATFFGWALLLIFVGIQYVLSNWEKWKLQEWIKHCCFGGSPGYKDEKMEGAKFREITGWSSAYA